MSAFRMKWIIVCVKRKYCILTVLGAFALVLIFNYEFTLSRSGVSRLLVPPAVATSRQFFTPGFNQDKHSPEVDRRSRESQMTGHAFSGKATRRFTDKRKFEFSSTRITLHLRKPAERALFVKGGASSQQYSNPPKP